MAQQEKEIATQKIKDFLSIDLETSGVFVLYSGDSPVYVGESENVSARVALLLSNPNWVDLELNRIVVIENNDSPFHEIWTKVSVGKTRRSRFKLPSACP